MNGADVAFPHLRIYFSNLPKGIMIGGFTIAYYGVIIALGMIGGLFLARWQAKRTGQNLELYMDYALYGILFALQLSLDVSFHVAHFFLQLVHIMAKVFHVIFHF